MCFCVIFFFCFFFLFSFFFCVYPVHEWGDLTSVGLVNATIVGGHFNPDGVPHACYPSTPRHVGDLGNIEITDTAVYTIVTWSRDLIELGSDGSANKHNILGRSLMIHGGADQCDQPTGHAGTLIGQGVIGIATPPAGITQMASIIPINQPTAAVAVLYPLATAGADQKSLSGTVWFVPADNQMIRVIANFANLQPNSAHGLHGNNISILQHDTHPHPHQHNPDPSTTHKNRSRSSYDHMDRLIRSSHTNIRTYEYNIHTLTPLWTRRIIILILVLILILFAMLISSVSLLSSPLLSSPLHVWICVRCVGVGSGFVSGSGCVCCVFACVSVCFCLRICVLFACLRSLCVCVCVCRF